MKRAGREELKGVSGRERRDEARYLLSAVKAIDFAWQRSRSVTLRDSGI